MAAAFDVASMGAAARGVDFSRYGSAVIGDVDESLTMIDVASLFDGLGRVPGLRRTVAAMIRQRQYALSALNDESAVAELAAQVARLERCAAALRRVDEAAADTRADEGGA